MTTEYVLAAVLDSNNGNNEEEDSCDVYSSENGDILEIVIVN